MTFWIGIPSRPRPLNCWIVRRCARRRAGTARGFSASRAGRLGIIVDRHQRRDQVARLCGSPLETRTSPPARRPRADKAQRMAARRDQHGVAVEIVGRPPQMVRQQRAAWRRSCRRFSSRRRACAGAVFCARRAPPSPSGRPRILSCSSARCLALLSLSSPRGFRLERLQLDAGGGAGVDRALFAFSSPP
jgi:hypothetical protein